MELINKGLKGSGYFCVIIKMATPDGDTLYAKKQLRKEYHKNEDYRYRLNREIELLKELKESDEVIDLVDYGSDEENENLWYLMPFADSNLYNYIKTNNQKLINDERFIIIEQVIEAIKFAHAKSILHRDISPSNVLVFNEVDGLKIKVSDFGLGKNKESISHYTHSSANGYGQVLYVSPEQRSKLKDSTKCSDIYSLGKLVYFIWTGKDPIDIKTCEFSSLISRATEEESEKRFQSIEEFESNYLKIKKVISQKEIPDKYKTLDDLIEDKNKIDWNYFHQLSVAGNYYNHPYSDYISSVISILDTPEQIKKYYIEVGSGIKDFVKTFCEKITECLGTTGWPFSAMSEFGLLLKRLYLIVDDDSVGLNCLKHLWFLGFEADQWSVQEDFKKPIIGKPIRNNIAPQLGEYIVDSIVNVDLGFFRGIEMPSIIKVSIIESNEAAMANAEKAKSSADDFEF